MTQSFIQIEGQTLDPSKLTLPANRENRDAWALDQNDATVVVVDPAKVTANKEAEAAQIESTIINDQVALRAIANVIADVAFRVSTGNVPQNLTKAKAREFVRNALKAEIREALDLDL